MFGWIKDFIYELLYGISKAMYWIIDMMMACGNMLVGIQPITYEGKEMDFLTFLMRNPNITFAFTGAVIIAVILVILFSVFMIIRSVSSEKIEKTPAQIAVQTGKTLLTFLFIPAAMMVTIWFTNVLMQVLYSTTLGGSPDGMGRFLAGSFGTNGYKGGRGTPDTFFLDPDFKYTSYSSVSSFIDMSEYDYFVSWIACIVIIISLGMTLLMFVDRAISLVVLFILSPLSISASVLDDGARFKLWRDQFLTKFLTGYGCIIGINIYILVVVSLTDSSLVFFESSTLNYVAKILIIVGGGVSMTKLMALIGNLIVAGAGSNEMRDTALAMAGMGRVMGGAAGFAWGAAKAPFKAGRGIYNFSRDTANRGFSTAVGQRLGFRTSRDYKMEQAQLNMGGYGRGGGGGGGNRNAGGANNVRNNGRDVVGGIIGGANPGGNNGGNQGGNRGGGNNNNPGGGMVNNAVNNALNGGGRRRANSVNVRRRNNNQ